MKTLLNKINVKFLAIYLFGIVLLGAGVILFSRASLGSAPWDTAILNLERLMTHLGMPISKGTSSLIHTSVLLLFVLILQRKPQPLLAIIPMVLISFSIDLWDTIFFVNILTENLNLLTRIVFFVIATFLMTFGLASIIISGYQPNVYDDFHLTLLKVFKIKSFSMGRWIVEFLGLSLGLMYALIQNDGLGAVSWLSLFLALTFGYFIQFFVNIYKRLELINRNL